MSRVHFTLKRKGWGYDDVYEALKTGEKKIEYRPSSPFWISRLFTKDGQEMVNNGMESIKNLSAEIGRKYWKHDKAKFVVGYTKYPRLYADITDIRYLPATDEFAIYIENVVEEKMNKCIHCGEWIPLTDYFCNPCYWQVRQG